MSTAGTFMLIKNEATWIAAHLMSWLPYVDQAVFFDGNSTDGTLEILGDFAKNHPFGKRITLVKDKDPKDLSGDYVRLFNECLRTLHTDFAIFAHPDMILDKPGNIGFLGDAVAYYSEVRSFAGEPGGQLYEIKSGRDPHWKNIYRLHNPDLGLHYFGAYGSRDEDCYFSKITGTKHQSFRGPEFYPYKVKDSGIRLSHYSDVRPLARRLDRMTKCLANEGVSYADGLKIAAEHPRVTFKAGRFRKHDFDFVPVETPQFLKEAALV